MTIHNFTDQVSFPVKVEVTDKNDPKKVVFTSSKNVTAETGTFKDISFNLEIAAGSYNVKVSAIGVETVSQLGVGTASGSPKLTVVDYIFGYLISIS